MQAALECLDKHADKMPENDYICIANALRDAHASRIRFGRQLCVDEPQILNAETVEIYSEEDSEPMDFMLNVDICAPIIKNENDKDIGLKGSVVRIRNLGIAQIGALREALHRYDADMSRAITAERLRTEFALSRKRRRQNHD